MKMLKLILCFMSGVLFPGCEDLFVKPAISNQNVEDFEAAWNRINDTYPFLEYKKIHWDSLHTVYLPRVEAARGDEFYFVLHDLLAIILKEEVRCIRFILRDISGCVTHTARLW